MMNSNALQQYQRNNILTTTPGELTLMLYNGLVQCIKLAIANQERADREEVNKQLVKGQDIIRELLCTLNMKYEISGQMAPLYEYMLDRLIQANIRKDRAIMEEVLDFAEQFRDTWIQVLNSVKQG